MRKSEKRLIGSTMFIVGILGMVGYGIYTGYLSGEELGQQSIRIDNNCRSPFRQKTRPRQKRDRQLA